MGDMNLDLRPSGFGFESLERMVVTSSGKEVGLSPVMDSRLEGESSAPILLYAGIIICNKHLYSSVCTTGLPLVFHM
ncbi:hypothetical protein TNCV_2904241 [Trichonephila clavipes]|nr:hypothetical protein TNCV_2904241 [Trichonephila clavipes]